MTWLCEYVNNFYHSINTPWASHGQVYLGGGGRVVLLSSKGRGLSLIHYQYVLSHCNIEYLNVYQEIFALNFPQRSLLLSFYTKTFFSPCCYLTKLSIVWCYCDWVYIVFVYLLTFQGQRHEIFNLWSARNISRNISIDDHHSFVVSSLYYHSWNKWEKANLKVKCAPLITFYFRFCTLLFSHSYSLRACRHRGTVMQQCSLGRQGSALSPGVCHYHNKALKLFVTG